MMALPNHAQDCSRKHVHATVLLVALDQLFPCAYLPQDGAKGPDVCLCAARLQPRKDHVRWHSLQTSRPYTGIGVALTGT